MELGEKLAPSWVCVADFEVRIRPLTVFEKMEIWPQIKFEDGDVVIPAKTMRRLFEAAVQDWRGVTEKGEQVPYSVDAAERLPANVIIDIARQIIEKSTITEDEQKN
jgi:hypothetical protein